ncbi:MAG TPA: SIS domain-containing protein [Bacillota bacterium]|nr:SIS domain-containing protein [Bacillota bacterium]
MSKVREYIDKYLEETAQIVQAIDRSAIEKAIDILWKLRRKNGCLYILGVGGGAGNASHAVNDFRKIAGIKACAPTDNVSELTAWTNDTSWEAFFENWLKTTQLQPEDCLLIFSVGGGTVHTSYNLVKAMEYAKKIGAAIISVVSRDGGRAGKLSDACVHIPVVCGDRITPHCEEWQAVVWHLMANALASS